MHKGQNRKLENFGNFQLPLAKQLQVLKQFPSLPSFRFLYKGQNRKLGDFRQLRKLGILFPSFLLPSFLFWVLGQNRKIGREKVGNKIPNFPSFPRFPNFRPGRLSMFTKNKCELIHMHKTCG